MVLYAKCSYGTQLVRNVLEQWHRYFESCMHFFLRCLQMYYRNASAAIVCFDITNEDSFTKMKDWVEELKQNVTLPDFVACQLTFL